MRLFTTFTIGLFAICGAYAQLATTTALVGTITDASGKTVPGAKITAVNTGTHDTYTAITREQGYYNIQFVAVGHYDLKVEQPGFGVARGIGLQAGNNQGVRSDVTRKVGK